MISVLDRLQFIGRERPAGILELAMMMKEPAQSLLDNDSVIIAINLGCGLHQLLHDVFTEIGGKIGKALE